MKQFVLAGMLFISFNLLRAQAPQQINYQAIARSATGTPIINQLINLRLKIHSGTANGVIQYSETRTVTTNAFGLFAIAIGSTGASDVFGTLAAVSWNNGDKYLRVEIDAAGGNNFIDMGTSQLLSVPYALNSGDNQWIANGNHIGNKNTGNIGIGTNSPSYDLHINRNDPSIGFTDATKNHFSGYISGDSSSLYINAFRKTLLANEDPGNLILQTGNNILTAGNVGIGVEKPAAKLDVSGGIRLNGELNRFNSGMANLIPLCYGVVDEDGSILSGTGNVAVLEDYNSPAFYNIVYFGASLLPTDIVIVTPYAGTAPRTANVSISPSGYFRIGIFNTETGYYTKAKFSFVVFRP